jgi:hypothetical protein
MNERCEQILARPDGHVAEIPSWAQDYTFIIDWYLEASKVRADAVPAREPLCWPLAVKGGDPGPDRRVE